MHLQDSEGPEEFSFVGYTPSEQVILAPEVGIPVSKKGKAVASHDCRGIMTRRDIRVCFEKCTVSFVMCV